MFLVVSLFLKAMLEVQLTLKTSGAVEEKEHVMGMSIIWYSSPGKQSVLPMHAGGTVDNNVQCIYL